MNWDKFVRSITDRLPPSLVLVFGLGVIALYLFLGAKQVWSAISIVVLVIVLGFWFHYLEQRRKEAEGNLRRVVEPLIAKGGQPRDLWTRPMLQLPLKQSVFENVLQVFKGALRETSQALSDLLPSADPSGVRVRANIFLPTSEGARDGDVCNLIIPKHDLAAPNGLQLNMEKGDELSMTFRPNQGATGRVFVEKRAIGALTHPAWLDETDKSKQKEIERWIYVRLHPEADLRKPGESLRTELGTSQFEMTDFQNRRVAESLTWIISMPVFLKADKAPEVVGVFNVDCLGYEVTPEQLRAIYYRVVPFAGVLAGVLKGSPTDRVAIFRLRESD
jgi:hypothetical protein